MKTARPVPLAELPVYRDDCIALLRRYFILSVEVGRLPAILGREIFTTRAQDFHVHSFEDTVLFVIDIERCLDRLDLIHQKLISYIVLQEYTQEETAALLGCTDRTIRNHFADALDSLSAILLCHRLMRRRSRPRRRAAAVVDIQACVDPVALPSHGAPAQFTADIAIPIPALLPPENLSTPLFSQNGA